MNDVIIKTIIGLKIIFGLSITLAIISRTFDVFTNYTSLIDEVEHLSSIGYKIIMSIILVYLFYPKSKKKGNVFINKHETQLLFMFGIILILDSIEEYTDFNLKSSVSKIASFMFNR